MDGDGDGIREKDGARLSLSLLVTPQSAKAARLAPLLQERWRRAGIELRVEKVDWAVYQQRLRSHDFDAMALLWSAADAENDLHPVFHSSQTGALNYGSYTSAAADALLESLRGEFDPGAPDGARAAAAPRPARGPALPLPLQSPDARCCQAPGARAHALPRLVRAAQGLGRAASLRHRMRADALAADRAGADAGALDVALLRPPRATSRESRSSSPVIRRPTPPRSTHAPRLIRPGESALLAYGRWAGRALRLELGDVAGRWPSGPRAAAARCSRERSCSRCCRWEGRASPRSPQPCGPRPRAPAGAIGCWASCCFSLFALPGFWAALLLQAWLAGPRGLGWFPLEGDGGWPRARRPRRRPSSTSRSRPASLGLGAGAFLAWQLRTALREALEAPHTLGGAGPRARADRGWSSTTRSASPVATLVAGLAALLPMVLGGSVVGGAASSTSAGWAC